MSESDKAVSKDKVTTTGVSGHSTSLSDATFDVTLTVGSSDDSVASTPASYKARGDALEDVK